MSRDDLTQIASAGAVGMTDVRDDFSVAIKLSDNEGATRSWDRVGIPLAAGICRDASTLALFSDDGHPLPLQRTPLAHWPDGSIKWLLCEWISGGAKTVYLKPSLALEPQLDRPVKVSHSAGQVIVGRCEATWRFAPGGALLGTSSDAANPLLRLDLESGGVAEAVVDAVEVLAEGPVRAAVRVTARAQCDGRDTGLVLVAESHFYADSALRKLTLTVRNRRRAAHPGGIWELGDAGSILIKDLSLRVESRQTDSSFSVTIGDGAEEVRGANLQLFQASSGGENWDSHNHVDRSGAVSLPFRGYRLSCDGREVSGHRASPIARLHGAGGVAIAVEKFWQNFPKALRCSDGAIEVGVFPRESTSPHELQGGEQKSHTLWIAEDPESAALLDSVRSGAMPRLDPDYVAETRAERFLSPASRDVPAYRDLVGAAIDGPSSLYVKREAIDEYGWRHFGDAYGDHEAAFHEGPTPLISHWNNQYDLVFGLASRFLATGDQRWCDLAADMAWHVLDVDIYHTDEDKAAYNHGLFWHTVHYIDAGKANHRSYPSGTVGGGPCAEHSYSRGLRLYYYLTGEHAARDAVVELADWILAMEDGSGTPFRFLAGGPTGLSSCSGNPNYHGPGRGPGNATETLLTTFELTGDRRYIERVEELMRRVVHPEDDQEGLCLLDAETRWYYTLYLQSLGRYLEIKHETGEHDANFAYGRDTLVAYATWMAEHEYPYLQRPEILEYPTETWSAQDVRKSEVLHFAARHTGPGDLQRRLLEKARYFFEYALEELHADPRAAYTRPVALLLGSGFSYDAIRAGAGELATTANSQFRHHARKHFTPQKRTALKRMRLLVVGGAAGLIASTVVGLVAFLIYYN